MYVKNLVRVFLYHTELISHIASAHEEKHIFEMCGAKFVIQIDLKMILNQFMKERSNIILKNLMLFL